MSKPCACLICGMHGKEGFKMPILGIDNGLDGGLCLLSEYGNTPPIRKAPMPTRKIAGRSKDGPKKEKREIDPMGILEALRWHTGPTDDLLVVIEAVPMRTLGNAGMTGLRSMAMSFGIVYGVCVSRGYRVVTVDAKDWQARMLGKVPKGETKQFALEAALRLWRGENWKATARSTTAHDGMVDAALIAEDARRLRP